MPKPTILQPGQSYTFRQYFEMSYEPEDILAEFGYTLKRQILALPQSDLDLNRLENLKSRIEEKVYLTLVSQAKPPVENG